MSIGETHTRVILIYFSSPLVEGVHHYGTMSAIAKISLRPTGNPYSHPSSRSFAITFFASEKGSIQALGRGRSGKYRCSMNDIGIGSKWMSWRRVASVLETPMGTKALSLKTLPKRTEKQGCIEDVTRVCPVTNGVPSFVLKRILSVKNSRYVNVEGCIT